MIICPYKAKDEYHRHVFYYGSEELYCDNSECLNLNQNKIFWIEGEGVCVGICKTNGFVDAENSELVAGIKESGAFKTLVKILEAEKKEESRKESIREAIQALRDESRQAIKNKSCS